MRHCSTCGKFHRDNDLFCLNCGSLLSDYEHARLSSLNYDLVGEEFLTQVANQFSQLSSQYSQLMGEFSSSLDEFTSEIKKDFKGISVCNIQRAH